MPGLAVSLSLVLLLLGAGQVFLDGHRRDPVILTRLCAAQLCDSDDPAALGNATDETTVEGQQQTLKFLELALANDPASPFRWCDLGEALLRNGNREQARRCFERAESLGPYNPPILMRVANFYFEVSEIPQALQRTVRVLDRVHNYDNVIFATYARMNVPVQTVLSNGIPVSAPAAQAYLAFLSARDQPGNTKLAWEWAAAHSLIDEKSAIDYVNQLWRNRQFALASQTWAGYLGRDRGDYLQPNLVFNGDFERPLSALLLDWQTQPVEGVSIALDESAHYSGKSSLRITFEKAAPKKDGNIAFQQVGQQVAVSPGRYHFQAFAKTSDLTTPQGVRLRIFDPEDPARLDMESDSQTGSTDWRKIEKWIDVRTPTRLLGIQVTRHRSEKFDNQITGIAWVDAAALTLVQ